jgi:hypothetical protein
MGGDVAGRLVDFLSGFFHSVDIVYPCTIHQRKDINIFAPAKLNDIPRFLKYSGDI